MIHRMIANKKGLTAASSFYIGARGSQQGGNLGPQRAVLPAMNAGVMPGSVPGGNMPGSVPVIVPSAEIRSGEPFAQHTAFVHPPLPVGYPATFRPQKRASGVFQAIERKQKKTKQRNWWSLKLSPDGKL